MPTEYYIFWTAVLMLANVPPQLLAFHLFIRWARFARRFWLRAAFISVATISLMFVVLRLIGYAFSDNLTLRIVTAVIFTFGSYLTYGMFWLGTTVIDRRIDEAMHTGSSEQKTSDILGVIVEELGPHVKRIEKLKARN